MWPDCSRDPDGLALLRAALTQPAEDTPRLLLADWLQEHDEEAVAVALRKSIGNRDEWGDFPDEVLGRWYPWNAILDGWVVILLMRWPLPENLSDSPWITFLDLSSAGATDTGLKDLAGLTNLTTLDLRYTQVSDAGLKELAGLTNLTTLSLYDTDVTGVGLKELAALTSLTTLSLGETEMTDAGLKELAGLKNLTSLSLHGCRHVTDAGLRELAALTSLTTLNLLTVTDRTLAVLRDINLLHTLSLATAANGKRPTKPEDVTTLDLRYERKVSNTYSVTDAGLKELAALKNLTTLDLGGTQVAGAGLKELATLTSLTTLRLWGTQVTDAGLKGLAALTSLTDLDLRGTLVTDAGVAELQMALPKCKISK